MIHKTAHKTLLAVLLNFILLVSCVQAQTITGKVVGVADGDTITVLQDHTQYKIRLYGIDTPERGQDFGNRAKQYTSGMVFGKQVQVAQKDKDRYGRVVGVSREIFIIGGLPMTDDVIAKYREPNKTVESCMIRMRLIDGTQGQWAGKSEQEHSP